MEHKRLVLLGSLILKESEKPMQHEKKGDLKIRRKEREKDNNNTVWKNSSDGQFKVKLRESWNFQD